ncbi:MAG: YheT family hydrolase, partial [Litorivicinus sp.]
NPHLQSIIPTRARRVRLPQRTRACIQTRDNDQLWVDQLDDKRGPVVIILHGLGGNSDSQYIRGMQAKFHGAGWNTWAWNARGALKPNLRPDTYHGGRHEDVEDLVRAANRPVAVIGFSLGAAMLINLLGRDSCPSAVKAAVAISCPFDFVQNARHLDGPSAVVYRRYLLGQLRKLTNQKREWALRHGHPWANRLPSKEALNQLTRFCDFDDQVTAPLNGFNDAMDLYHSVDPGRVVANIQVPTLTIQADDDPLFIRPRAPSNTLPKSLSLELTSGGGHVGFVQGRWPWNAEFYAETRALEFVGAQLERT